jgi:ATP phosphoribosyltransferase regulatory subunit
VIDTILTLRAPVRAALGALRDIAVDLPAIAPATDRFEARLEALNDLGIDLSSLPFDAAFGRTSMEYYDGFVFGFSGAPNMPHVATGGRYDALTARLGGGQAIPAVGGVIRPALVRALREKLA